MKTLITIALCSVVGLATAQQAAPSPSDAAPAQRSDPARLVALKKKLSDQIDIRIGRLEELEECIQAAPDARAIKTCREQQAAEAAAAGTGGAAEAKN